MAKRASDLEAVEWLVESDAGAAVSQCGAEDPVWTSQCGAEDPVWTTTEFVEIRHPHATPHVPVQPLSTVG